jgi:hypothetical protein
MVRMDFAALFACHGSPLELLLRELTTFAMPAVFVLQRVRLPSDA